MQVCEPCYAKNLMFEKTEKYKVQKPIINCEWEGCSYKFTERLDYEHHYNSHFLPNKQLINICNLEYIDEEGKIKKC